MKIHPFHLPWIRPCRCSFVVVYRSHIFYLLLSTNERDGLCRNRVVFLLSMTRNCETCERSRHIQTGFAPGCWNRGLVTYLQQFYQMGKRDKNKASRYFSHVSVQKAPTSFNRKTPQFRQSLFLCYQSGIKTGSINPIQTGEGV